MNKLYDIIIIGGGPAGLTAAIYGKRAGKTVLLIENNSFGGQITLTPEVENYPAFSKISGAELADRLYNQALDLETEMLFDNVKGIKDGKEKTVTTDFGEYKAKAIIIATGLKHRKTGLEAEERLVGRSVSYCAVCDGAFYKNKTVAVLGGGNTALGDAAFLADICEKVILIHRREEFRADAAVINKLKDKNNIEYVLNSEISDILGEERVSAVSVKKKDSGELKDIAIDGIFIAIGQIPQNDIFKDVVELDDYGFIKAGEDCKTSADGVFAAGDCRTKELNQITTAVSDGAVAATNASNYADFI